jgi:hypothetical protein
MATFGITIIEDFRNCGRIYQAAINSRLVGVVEGKLR